MAGYLEKTLRDYGYKGKEIAERLRKNGVAITRYLRRGEDFQNRMERLILLLNSLRAFLIIKSDPKTPPVISIVKHRCQ